MTEVFFDARAIAVSGILRCHLGVFWRVYSATKALFERTKDMVSTTTAVGYTVALGSAAVAALVAVAYLFQEKLLFMRNYPPDSRSHHMSPALVRMEACVSLSLYNA